MRYLTFILVGVVCLVAAVSGVYWELAGQSTAEAVHNVSVGVAAPGQSIALKDAIADARESLRRIEAGVRDYSALVVAKQRIGNDVVESIMFAKIREKPFSVYLRYAHRSDAKGVKGREVIFVQGQNGNNLIVHTPGWQDASVGKLKLDPNGWLAMQRELHPITQVGLANLCRQLLRYGEAVDDPLQVQIKRYPQAQTDGRPCSLLEIMCPVREPMTRAYFVRVLVDDELRCPIHIEVYEVPSGRGQDRRLKEEYSYLNLKLNNGYTDADFNPRNPKYKFP